MSRSKSTSSGKRAWDETMKREVGHVPNGSSLKVGPAPRTRASLRGADDAPKRVARRPETRDLRAKRRARLERLELTNVNDPVDKTEMDERRAALRSGEADAEFQPHLLLPENAAKAQAALDGRKPTGGRAAGKSPANAKRAKLSSSNDPALKKKMPVMFLADVLLAEHELDPTVLVRPEGQGEPTSFDFCSATAAPSIYPDAKVCDATGKLGRYKDPSTGLRFADEQAHAMLVENPPPWVKSTQAATVSPFWDAVALIRAEQRASLESSSSEESDSDDDSSDSDDSSSD